MTPLVVDSSVVVKWFSTAGEAYVSQAEQILQDARAGTVHLYVPELMKYEIGNVLWKGKKVPPAEAQSVLDTFYILPLQFVPETRLLAQLSYDLAATYDLTYYDAVFSALAQALGGVLVTSDTKHQGRIKHVQVVPLKEYKTP